MTHGYVYELVKIAGRDVRAARSELMRRGAALAAERTRRNRECRKRTRKDTQ